MTLGGLVTNATYELTIMPTIAIDAMGGDAGVAAATKAAAALSLTQEIGLLLVGHEDQINSVLRRSRYDGGYLTIQHCEQWISMDEPSRHAIESKPDASINVGARLVRDGAADALVSAGNTGACILACARHFERLPGVPRTALAAVFPTERRRGETNDPFSLILDVGATLEADANTLVAFGKMGSAYARCISRNAQPRVALLSNGEETHKGKPAIVEANRILRATPEINFIGNIEGLDLPRGRADVVVTDGFTGNVVLKMLEGMGETVVDLAKYAYRSKVTWKAGLLMLSGGLRQLKDLTDWQQYGGAPILGFDHLFIKAHGRSNARALQNAVKVAAKAVRSDLSGQIDQMLRQTAEPN